MIGKNDHIGLLLHRVYNVRDKVLRVGYLIALQVCRIPTGNMRGHHADHGNLDTVHLLDIPGKADGFAVL